MHRFPNGPTRATWPTWPTASATTSSRRSTTIRTALTQEIADWQKRQRAIAQREPRWTQPAGPAEPRRRPAGRRARCGPKSRPSSSTAACWPTPTRCRAWSSRLTQALREALNHGQCRLLAAHETGHGEPRGSSDLAAAHARAALRRFDQATVSAGRPTIAVGRPRKSSTRSGRPKLSEWKSHLRCPADPVQQGAGGGGEAAGAEGPARQAAGRHDQERGRPEVLAAAGERADSRKAQGRARSSSELTSSTEWRIGRCRLCASRSATSNWRTSVIQARDLAEDGGTRRRCRSGRSMPPSRSRTSMPPDKELREPAPGPGPAGGRRRRRGQDPGDRPTHPGTRLRILAPDALRPVPGREPPADAPGRRGVSLEECEELARRRGQPNGFVLAARYASRMLPQIFRIDDVLLEIEFAPEQRRLALEKLLASLPRQTSPPTTASAGSTSSGRPRRRTRSTRAARRSTVGPCPP